jgi:hypothetical protein
MRALILGAMLALTAITSLVAAPLPAAAMAESGGTVPADPGPPTYPMPPEANRQP